MTNNPDNATNNNTPAPPPAVSNSDSSINSLYQKYFGRDATTAELNAWKPRPLSEVETQLQNDYKNASGIAYD